MYRLLFSLLVLVAVGSLVGLWFAPLVVLVCWAGLTSFLGCWVLAVQLPDAYAGYIAAESRRLGGR